MLNNSVSDSFDAQFFYGALQSPHPLPPTSPTLTNPHQIYGDEVKQGEKKIGWLTLHYLKKIGWLTLHYLKKIKSLVSKNSTYSEVSYGKFETLNVFFYV